MMMSHRAGYDISVSILITDSGFDIKAQCLPFLSGDSTEIPIGVPVGISTISLAA